MFGLLRKKCWPIAVDIGADSVKLLQMQRTGSIVTVRACARWRSPNPGGDPTAAKAGAIVGVRELLRKGAFRGREVVSSLPAGMLHIKSVRLPRMSQGQLAQAVRQEAQERFGFDVTPDRLSYLNAGEVRQGAEFRDEYILMAARGEAIDEHLDLLSEMGLKPLHLDAEPIALFRGFERFLRRAEDAQAVTVVVDMGWSRTRVLVSRGRQICFVKSIDIGGLRITEALAKHLNLGISEALEVRARMIASDSRASDSADTVTVTVRDAVRAQVEDLAREIALCLRYCAVTFRGLRPEQVTLTGGEAYDQAVVGLLSENLGLPCKPGHPLKGIDLSQVDLGDRRGRLAEWAVCAGLAIRDNDKVASLETDDEQRRLSA
jgi:type IV pilus assembly protein PilM